MTWRRWLVGALVGAPVAVSAQAPQYTPVFLGSFTPGRINASGDVVGGVTVDAASRGLVARAGQAYQLLPLPTGMSSSIAVDITDQGRVVGAVAPGSSPEFNGRAAIWTPDGTGGYTVAQLGALPGHSISRANAANDVGDVVGYSSDGTFRYPVWFTAPSGVMDLSPTGVFDPVDINEERVLVDQSFTAKRLDLDTMVAQDLGVPSFDDTGQHFVATRAVAINGSGQVAAAAILATSTSCDREAARYTDGIGWQVFTGCGPYNSAHDVNDLGDVVMAANLVQYVRLEGVGTFTVQDRIQAEVGQWFIFSLSGSSINDSGQIVVSASNPTTGEAGALLLNPVATTATPPVTTGAQDRDLILLSASPNPFRTETMVRFDLPASVTIAVTIHDVAGRRVRRVLTGTTAAAGKHTVSWDGRDDAGHPLPSGVYFCALRAGETSRVSRIVLTR